MTFDNQYNDREKPEKLPNPWTQSDEKQREEKSNPLDLDQPILLAQQKPPTKKNPWEQDGLPDIVIPPVPAKKGDDVKPVPAVPDKKADAKAPEAKGDAKADVKVDPKVEAKVDPKVDAKTPQVKDLVSVLYPPDLKGHAKDLEKVAGKDILRNQYLTQFRITIPELACLVHEEIAQQQSNPSRTRPTDERGRVIYDIAMRLRSTVAGKPPAHLTMLGLTIPELAHLVYDERTQQNNSNRVPPVKPFDKAIGQMARDFQPPINKPSSDKSKPVVLQANYTEEDYTRILWLANILSHEQRLTAAEILTLDKPLVTPTLPGVLAPFSNRALPWHRQSDTYAAEFALGGMLARAATNPSIRPEGKSIYQNMRRGYFQALGALAAHQTAQHLLSNDEYTVSGPRLGLVGAATPLGLRGLYGAGESFYRAGAAFWNGERRAGARHLWTGTWRTTLTVGGMAAAYYADNALSSHSPTLGGRYELYPWEAPALGAAAGARYPSGSIPLGRWGRIPVPGAVWNFVVPTAIYAGHRAAGGNWSSGLLEQETSTLGVIRTDRQNETSASLLAAANAFTNIGAPRDKPAGNDTSEISSLRFMEGILQDWNDRRPNHSATANDDIGFFRGRIALTLGMADALSRRGSNVGLILRSDSPSPGQISFALPGSNLDLDGGALRYLSVAWRDAQQLRYNYYTQGSSQANELAAIETEIINRFRTIYGRHDIEGQGNLFEQLVQYGRNSQEFAFMQNVWSQNFINLAYEPPRLDAQGKPQPPARIATELEASMAIARAKATEKTLEARRAKPDAPEVDPLEFLNRPYFANRFRNNAMLGMAIVSRGLGQHGTDNTPLTYHRLGPFSDKAGQPLELTDRQLGQYMDNIAVYLTQAAMMEGGSQQRLDHIDDTNLRPENIAAVHLANSHPDLQQLINIYRDLLQNERVRNALQEYRTSRPAAKPAPPEAKPIAPVKPK